MKKMLVIVALVLSLVGAAGCSKTSCQCPPVNSNPACGGC